MYAFFVLCYVDDFKFPCQAYPFEAVNIVEGSTVYALR